MGTQNRVLSITAHGSTVKSPPGLGWLGSVEKLLVQKLSNIWSRLCALTVCVLHSPACLCVARCPQLPRDNIQFVRKPTDFESARSSTPPLLRSIHEFFRLLSLFPFFLLSFLPPSVHPPRPSLTLFPIFSYRTPVVVVYFFFLWETVHSCAVHLLYLFHCFVIFFFFNISVAPYWLYPDFTEYTVGIWSCINMLGIYILYIL